MALTALTTQSQAQIKKAAISDLAFMSGTWYQQHPWGDMEEYWAPPAGDNMVCTFRCIDKGKAVFYEFIIIEQTDSVPVMKLRHFGKGNIGWEEKDQPNVYPLVALEKNKAVFEAPDRSVRLTYTRVASGKMDIILEKTGKDNTTEKTEFNYTLKLNNP